MNDLVRKRYIVNGQVQGVGFRPFVYRTALDNGLTGTVRNDPDGVIIEVQGASPSVETFGLDLERKTPPLARIVSLESEGVAPEEGEEAFIILASTGGEGHKVLISPDTATCPDCLRELFDPKDPRYLYPFINCTNCGPRYTITKSIPYDREYTSMACFPLCERCAAEYGDPLNRRFHAQPNACPACGPEVWLTDESGVEAARSGAALEELARRLAEGRIFAIKGLGGFHLACSAADAEAVAALRERKNRPHKPLALMVPDVETARRIADVSPAAEEWLTGVKRPIVLCPARSGTADVLAPSIAPDTQFFGVMLPYTPLHHVLLRLFREAVGPGAVPALVMTSGNSSGEPISLGNREALARLHHIADGFLFHNRDILIRADDSVIRVHPVTSRTEFLRRARGFAPEPVDLPPLRVRGGSPAAVLGVGPELKNTLCLTKGDQAFVSQHIGDLENIETLGFFGEIADHLQSILQTRPEAVIRDLHPDYLSTRAALDMAEADPGLRSFAVQHHVAHIHAVLAEHNRTDPVIGLALDGTGLGEDNTLWGGECLLVQPDPLAHRRLGSLAPFRLPGGEAAIRAPWRIARGCLWMLGRNHPGDTPWPWLETEEAADRMVVQMLEKDINCPVTTSCGRLFDAVAALCGVCTEISYEGQAAILLEAAQDMEAEGAYPLPFASVDGLWQADTLALFAAAAEDWEVGVAPGVIARRFHMGLVRGLADMTAAAAAALGLGVVALSGGVMQNLTVSTELDALLRAKGLEVLQHVQLPPNDGCISLGQAAWGRLKLAQP